jgi:hypothetical protein
MYFKHYFMFYVKKYLFYINYFTYVWVQTLKRTLMQALGTKSVASFLTWMITAALFLSAVGGGIAILIMVVLIITSTESQDFLVSAWPVWVDRAQAPFELVAAHRNLKELKLNVNQGTLHFASAGVGYYFFKLLDAVFSIGVVVVILALLRHIFATLAQNHPFTP